MRKGCFQPSFVQVGDVVTAVNDQKVGSPKDLSRLVAVLPVGRTAMFEVLRRGKARTVNIEIERRQDDLRLASADGPGGRGSS